MKRMKKFVKALWNVIRNRRYLYLADALSKGLLELNGYVVADDCYYIEGEPVMRYRTDFTFLTHNKEVINEFRKYSARMI